MNVVQWSPVRELEEMSKRFDRFCGGLLGRRYNGNEALTVADWMPVVDIEETEHEYEIKAELPGLTRKDVKVTLDDGVLTLQGERKREKEEKGKRFHRIERVYGSFTRSFTLPGSVEESKVTAEFNDGLLRIHLPKSQEAKPKMIEVKVA
jgi:HSP20 family protein